jgi:hypothetical protein
MDFRDAGVVDAESDGRGPTDDLARKEDLGRRIANAY